MLAWVFTISGSFKKFDSTSDINLHGQKSSPWPICCHPFPQRTGLKIASVPENRPNLADIPNMVKLFEKKKWHSFEAYKSIFCYNGVNSILPVWILSGWIILAVNFCFPCGFSWIQNVYFLSCPVSLLSNSCYILPSWYMKRLLSFCTVFLFKVCYIVSSRHNRASFAWSNFGVEGGSDFQKVCFVVEKYYLPPTIISHPG